MVKRGGVDGWTSPFFAKSRAHAFVIVLANVSIKSQTAGAVEPLVVLFALVRALGGVDRHGNATVSRTCPGTVLFEPVGVLSILVACNPDESSQWSGGRALSRGSVKPDPEPEPGSSRGLELVQQVMDHTRLRVVVHRGQSPALLPAAPPGLPEWFLLEKHSVASFFVAQGIPLSELSGGTVLTQTSRGQTQQQEPSQTQEGETAAATAGLHLPPQY